MPTGGIRIRAEWSIEQGAVVEACGFFAAKKKKDQY
jgi:hypothetical protein